MTPEVEILLGVISTLGTAVSVLFATLMLVYKEALEVERERNATILAKIADTSSQSAVTLQAIDKDNGRIADAVDDIAAEMRVAAITATRRLGP